MLRSNVVGLVARNSPDYVERFFHYLSKGVVVVTLRAADDRDRISACGIVEIVEPGDGYGWVVRQAQLSESTDLAHVAFTSGTEGEPKGVLLTHLNLSNTMRRLQEKMGMDASIREYVGIPVYHSFGFGRCRAIAAVGGRAYLPRAGFNIREICSLLAADQINAVSAVPSLWRIALKNRNLIERYGNKMQWIEIGSQPMSGAEKLALRSLFPSARIVQHYGLTEASRSTLLDVSLASLSELDSVGEPNGDVEIDTSEGGRIRIRGGHVAAEVLIAGKRGRNMDEEGWFRTNDLGEIRSGKLYFNGRLDQVINSGGIKVSPDSLETLIMAALGIEDGIAVAKIPDEMRGDGVLVAIKNDVGPSNHRILDASAEALRSLGVDASSSVHAMRVSELPITQSGKVKRQALSAQYQESMQYTKNGGPRPWIEHRSTLNNPAVSYGTRIKTLARKWGFGRTNSVRGLYEKVFPARRVAAGDTFVTLGGDSLSFVEVSIGLEELLGQLPENWQILTIAELESIRPRSTFLHLVDTSLLLRFVGILAVVTVHFTPLDVGGATFLLLVIVGFNFARFQLSNVLATGSVMPVLISALRLGLPLFLMVAMLEVRHQKLDVMDLALLGNWKDHAIQRMDFWFVALVVQVLVITAMIMAVPAVRAYARSNPLAFSYGLLIAVVATATFVPFLWSTEYLYNRVPHMLMWLFALGWIVHQATSVAQKLVAVAIAITLPLWMWGTEGLPWVGHGPVWVAAGCVALLFIREVPVPRVVSRLVYWVGGASMFIYIVHWSARSIWNRIVPGEHLVADVFVGIVAGVIAWWLWESGARFLLGKISRREAMASEPNRL